MRKPLNPLAIIRGYEKGMYTRGEIPCGVFTRLNEENVQSFVEKCPEEYLSVLKEASKDSPEDGDDVGWSKVIFLRMVCYARDTTQEEIRADKAEYTRQFRNGVRIFRQALKGTKNA